MRSSKGKLHVGRPRRLPKWFERVETETLQKCECRRARLLEQLSGSKPVVCDAGELQ